MLHFKFEFHSTLNTLTYFTAKNRSTSFICINGLKNHIEASYLVHTLIMWVSWSLLIFAWAIIGPLVDKTLGKGKLVELPASDTWCLSFIRIRSLPLKSFPDFFSKCFAVSTWKLVYTLSRLHNILSSCFMLLSHIADDLLHWHRSDSMTSKLDLKVIGEIDSYQTSTNITKRADIILEMHISYNIHVSKSVGTII